MSLFHRTPEGIARAIQMVDETSAALPADLDKTLRADYELKRASTDPPTFDEFLAGLTISDRERTRLHLLRAIMNSELVGNIVFTLRWAVIRTHRSQYRLLTSDRPIIMGGAIKEPDGNIIMPISPDRVFAAAHSEKLLLTINEHMQHGGGVQILNQRIVRQARKYVWGTNDTALQFIEPRLGDKIPCSPWE
jgi:hypothetical protein